MNKKAYVWRLRKWLLKYAVSGPVRVTRERYDRGRALTPRSRLRNVDVYGDSRFTESIIQAFLQLQHAYPYGYSLVQRYVHAIEQSGTIPDLKMPAGALAGIGVRSEQTSPEGNLLVSAEQYAAFLVRFATQRKRGLMYAPKSSRAEWIGRKREEHALKLLYAHKGL